MLSKDDFRTLVSNWNYKTINQKYNIVESLENSEYTDSITINKLIQKYSGEDVLESILEFESQNEQTGGNVPDVSKKFLLLKDTLEKEYKVGTDSYKKLQKEVETKFNASDIGKNLNLMKETVKNTISQIQEEYKKISSLQEEGTTSNSELEKKKEELEKQIKELEKQMQNFEEIYKTAEKEKKEKEITEELKNKLINEINQSIKDSVDDIKQARRELPSVAKALNEGNTTVNVVNAAAKFKKNVNSPSPTSPNQSTVPRAPSTTNQQQGPASPTSQTSTSSPKKNLDKSWPKGINKSGNALLNKYKGTMSRADRRKINKLCNECGVNRAKNGEWCKWCEKKPKINQKYYSDTESDVLESVFRRMGI